MESNSARTVVETALKLPENTLQHAPAANFNVVDG